MSRLPSLRWCFWLDAEPRPGHQNMALDDALLDFAVAQGVGVLRLYRWSPPCLSFGRHEPAARRYDRARIASLGLDVTRRPTGGRAVWHARELTYAVAAPAEAGSLGDVHADVHRLMSDALHRLGASPTSAPRPDRTPGPDAGPCFASAVGGELLVQGRKVLGSAQLRREGGLLQHGSLLLDDDQAMVRALALAPPLPATEVALSRALGRPVSWEDAALAIQTAAESSWPGPWTALPVAPVWRAADRLAGRYRDPAWIWQR